MWESLKIKKPPVLPVKTLFMVLWEKQHQVTFSKLSREECWAQTPLQITGDNFVFCRARTAFTILPL